MHSQGLVGVFKALHDELDATVLLAYGWDDLAPTLRQAQGRQSASNLCMLRLLINPRR